MQTKILFLILPLFSFLSCQNSLNNRVDELYLLCGDGAVEGKDYILVDNVENGLQLDVFHSDGNLLPVTQKGCVERPKSGEVFLANKDRGLGLWIGADTEDKISLKPIQNKILPTTCNSVIHGDGLGFSLRFTSEANELNNRFKHAKVQILTPDKSESLHIWAPRPIMPVLDYQFDQDKVIAGGEYVLSVDLKDDLTGVSSNSECVLRIDYSNLRISPADKIKNIRKYNNQEVLVVEPGYEADFYVSEGFRDVSIEYCVKKIALRDFSKISDPEFTRCEVTQDFLNSKPKKMDEGFWLMAFKGKRGKIEGSWQNAVFLIDKVCNGRFDSLTDIVSAGCTVIKGDVDVYMSSERDIGIFEKDIDEKLDWLGSIQGDLSITHLGSEFSTDYRSIFNNLAEIGGNFSLNSANMSVLHSFDNLRDIGGNFFIQRATYLKSIEGFKNLESIGNIMDVSESNNLRSIDGFKKLKSVRHLILTRLPIETFELPALQSLRKLELRNLMQLRDLKGLEKLNEVKEITFYMLPRLTSMAGLNIQGTIENLELNSLTNLDTLQGFRGREISSLSILEMPALQSGFDDSSGVELTGEFRLFNSPLIISFEDFPFASHMKRISVTSKHLSSMAGLERVSTLDQLNLELGLSSQELFASLNIDLFPRVKDLVLNSETASPLEIRNSKNELNLENLKINGFSSVKISSEMSLSVKSLTIDRSPLTDLNFLSDFESIGELWFVSLPVSDFSHLKEIVKLDTLRLSLDSTNNQVKDLSKLDLRSLILQSTSSGPFDVVFSDLEDFDGLRESLLIGDGVCLKPETLKGLSTRINSPLAIAPSSYQTTSYPGIFASSSSSCTPSYFN